MYERLDEVIELIDNTEDEIEIEELKERRDELEWQIECAKDEVYTTHDNY